MCLATWISLGIEEAPALAQRYGEHARRRARPEHFAHDADSAQTGA
jgi:hypothetical protein